MATRTEHPEMDVAIERFISGYWSDDDHTWSQQPAGLVDTSAQIR